MKARWTYGVAALLVAGMSQASQLELAPRFWFPSVGGAVVLATGNTGAVVPPIDLAKDAAVKSGALPEVRLNWNFGKKTSARLTYWGSTFDGDNTFQKKITVGGTTIDGTAAGITMNTHASFNYLTAGVQRNFIRNNRWELGGLFDLKIPFGKVRVNVVRPQVATEGAFMNKDLLPIPTVGFNLAVRPYKRFTLGCEVAGMSLGDMAWGIDWQAGVRYQPDKNISLEGGYHMIKFHAQSNDKNIVDRSILDVNLRGPYVQGNIAF